MKKLLILAFLLLGCFSMASYAAKPKAKHVVYIGLDGWGSYSMPKANMPTVKSLMETGCYTMQKRTVLPSSSAVNWASMFMGVRSRSSRIYRMGVHAHRNCLHA